MHGILVDGFVGSATSTARGRSGRPTIRLISADPDENDWLAVHQVTVARADFERRFDIVLYCNGMPISVIELKRAGSRYADPAAAHEQLKTYLREFPMAFRFSVFTLVSDGLSAKYGTPFTPLHHFSPWNVDDDGEVVELGVLDAEGEAVTGLELALFGLYNQERFLQLMRSFTAFDEGADGLLKRIAKPHQYFAVTKAVASTILAVESNGKAGVVWHTQGSGKSMEMELYANLVIRAPKLLNPTIIVITDRNELDGQLYNGFQISRLLPEQPQQIRKGAPVRGLCVDGLDLVAQVGFSCSEVGHPGAQFVDGDQLLGERGDHPGDRGGGLGQRGLQSLVLGDGRVAGAGGGQALVDLGGDQRGVGDQRGDVVPHDGIEVVGPDRGVAADPAAGVAVVVRAQAPVVEDLLVGGAGAGPVVGVAAAGARGQALQQGRDLGVPGGEPFVVREALFGAGEGLLGDDRRDRDGGPFLAGPVDGLVRGRGGPAGEPGGPVDPGGLLAR